MGNFFTSLFSSSKPADPVEEKVRNDQKNFDILKYDGVRAQKMGRLPYAIKCFTEALNIQEDFETMNYLASAYNMSGKPAEALETLDRMVELEPDHVETLLARVSVLFMLDKDAEVVACCEHVIELDASNSLPYYLIAKAKRAIGDPIGAIADLTKAISLKDDFTDAYLLRAEVLLFMKQGEEALSDIEKTISLAPEEETIYLVRGKVYELLGDQDAAADDYQQVLDLNPFNEDACILKGNLLISREQLDEAIVFFDEAIEMKPDFAKAYAERGRAKNLKGDKEGAFEDLKKSIELNPEGEEARKIEGQHTNFETKSYISF